jgi:hypothetical protein
MTLPDVGPVRMETRERKSNGDAGPDVEPDKTGETGAKRAARQRQSRWTLAGILQIART